MILYCSACTILGNFPSLQVVVLTIMVRQSCRYVSPSMLELRTYVSISCFLYINMFDIVIGGSY